MKYDGGPTDRKVYKLLLTQCSIGDRRFLEHLDGLWYSEKTANRRIILEGVQLCHNNHMNKPMPVE